MKSNLSKLAGLILISIAFITSSSFISNPEKTGDKKNVVVLTTQNFDSNIKDGIVLVDFWAAWCGPCKRQAPILDKVADNIGKKAVIAKLDVDRNRPISGRYRVSAIPTIIIFKDGKEVDRLVGLQNEEKLMAKINALL